MDTTRTAPRTARGIIISIVVRLAALAAAMVVYGWAYDLIVYGGHPDESADADFGFGFIAFGLAIVLALAWGAWDGRRWTLGPLAIVWGVVGLLAGILMVVRADFDAPRHVVLFDLALLTPFTAALIIVPAVVAGAVAGAAAAPHARLR